MTLFIIHHNGTILIDSVYGQIRYLYYTEKQAVQLYRRHYGLKGKHLQIIRL